MSVRAELEAALAAAEANWRKASEHLDKVQTERARANAEWDRIVNDRRSGSGDRRKANSFWNHAFA
ncbi:MAG: hypothetical protein ABIH03_01900, partial [Pseudomonadota bacterium]